ncbi:hypothetical protein TNCV_1977531 [Trichonephila clavipes]|nr:hypothetical protein TNCV_1977531 [Trichonephila clavipes]
MSKKLTIYGCRSLIVWAGIPLHSRTHLNVFERGPVFEFSVVLLTLFHFNGLQRETTQDFWKVRIFAGCVVWPVRSPDIFSTDHWGKQSKLAAPLREPSNA